MESFQAYQESQKLKLAIRISAVAGVALGILTIAHFQESIFNSITIGIGCLVAFLSLIYSSKTKVYIHVFYLLSISAVVLPGIAMNTLHESTHYADCLWMMDGILLAYMGIGKRFGLFLLIVASVFATVFSIVVANTHITTVFTLTAFHKLALTLELVSALYLGGYVLLVLSQFYEKSNAEVMLINENLKQHRDQILRQDEERTLLVKEIHHRVKNNLQIITSLLRIQSLELDDDSGQKQFSEAINRIIAMSMIHEKLYQEELAAHIEVSDYIQDLSNEVFRSYKKSNKIKLELKVQVDYVGLKTIVPLGLLLNELIANSLEHAFSNKDAGIISIDLYLKENGLIHMQFKDTGDWKTPERKGSSFGLDLIQMLVEQMEGEFKLDKSNGANYTFLLKNLDE